jgi:hypothetical protein
VIVARPLAAGVVLAGPGTRTEDGVVFAESRMARVRGEETVLVDPNPGPGVVADGLEAACRQLGADLVVMLDVGGDALGDGSERGLASPLCDAVMLAAGIHLQRRGHQVIAAVFGPGCDGELTIDEVLDHVARIAAAGGLIGVEGMSPAVADELDRACAEIPTEASAQAVRCARGEIGVTTIRGGRREVMLSPLGALTFYLDPSKTAAATARLAGAVLDASGLREANDRLHEMGIRTELDYERAMVEA